jgi:hypothetical protein
MEPVLLLSKFLHGTLFSKLWKIVMHNRSYSVLLSSEIQRQCLTRLRLVSTFCVIYQNEHQSVLFLYTFDVRFVLSITLDKK